MAEEVTKPLAVKLKTAASMLGVSEISVRRKIASGEIRACRAFRHPLIEVAELQRFLDKTTYRGR